MSSRTAAKVAIGTAVAGGVGLGVFFLTRKARAAEEEAGFYRGQAKSAAARAARAEQAAVDAGKREQQVQALVAWTQAHAQRAGIAARAAIDNANRAATAARIAAVEAGDLYAQAQAERQTDRKSALAREAGLKDRHAKELAAQADAAAQAARTAEAEARKRAEAENKARAAETEARKLREQTTQIAAKEKQVAISETGPDLVNIECSRQAIASGFQELKTAVKKQNPSFTDQKATNTAASVMQKQGVVLDKPNPALAFWQQPCATIRAQVQGTINTYLAAVKRAPTAPPAYDTSQDAPLPTPTVTTDPGVEKRNLTEMVWVKAIQYAQKAATLAGRPLSPQEAERSVSAWFRVGTQLGPGFPAAPPLSALSAPDPFWAQDLDTVKRSLLAGYNNVVAKVNVAYDLIVSALTPDGKTIWARTDELQRDPNGKIIMREGAAVAGRRTYYPLAKSGARSLSASTELAGGRTSFAGYDFAFGSAFDQAPEPFCTVV